MQFENMEQSLYAHNEIGNACDQADMLPTAVADTIAVIKASPDFAIVEPASADGFRQLVHIPTGKTIKDWINTVGRTVRPHCWPQAAPDNSLVEQVRQGNATAAGRLAREVGEQQYEILARKVGRDPWTLKRIGDAVESTDSKSKDTKSSNPWANCAANVDEKGRYNVQARQRQYSIVKSLGSAKGAELARAANSWLGSPGPNVKQLAPRT